MKTGRYYTRLDNKNPFFTKGKHYKVTGITKDGDILIEDDSVAVYSFTEEDFNKDFKEAPVSIEERTLYVGCVLEHEVGQCKVLGLLDELVFVSMFVEFDVAGEPYSYSELIKCGYKVVDETPEETLTKEQASKKLSELTGKKITIK